jgi:hypothetical protein
LPADKQMALLTSIPKIRILNLLTAVVHASAVIGIFLCQSNHDWLIASRVGFKTKKPVSAEQV